MQKVNLTVFQQSELDRDLKAPYIVVAYKKHNETYDNVQSFFKAIETRDIECETSIKDFVVYIDGEKAVVRVPYSRYKKIDFLREDNYHTKLLTKSIGKLVERHSCDIENMTLF